MGRKECSVKCEVWRKQWEVGGVKCGVWSVQCGVWSLSLECEERSVKCEVWSVKCEVWSAKEAVRSEKCGVWSVKCGVWSLKFGVRRVQCAVWGVECRGKDTVGTGCLWTVGHLCLGNFRRRLARVYVNWYPIHNGENSMNSTGWPPNTPYDCAEARRTQVADATFRDIWPYVACHISTPHCFAVKHRGFHWRIFTAKPRRNGHWEPRSMPMLWTAPVSSPMDALRRIKNESLQAALLCLNIPHVSVLGLCRQAKPKTGFCDERSAHTSYAVIVSPKLYTSSALRKCCGQSCTLIDMPIHGDWAGCHTRISQLAASAAVRLHSFHSVRRIKGFPTMLYEALWLQDAAWSKTLQSTAFTEANLNIGEFCCPSVPQ